MSLAKAFITGAIVKAPEKRFTSNDTAIAGFTINFDPVNEGLIRVVAFGQLAETVANQCNIGDSVVVEGRLQINSYKMPNGKDKKVFEIMANAVEKINSGVSSEPKKQQNENIVSFNQEEVAEDLIDEDEIPF